MAALYGFGAAGAQTIEDVLARRLAWEKFRAAQDAENRRLAMAEAQAQREGERWATERPALESGTRVTLATEPEAMKRPGLLNAATAAGTKASEASTEQTLLETGETRKEYGARTPAWYAMQGTPQPWQKFVSLPKELGGKSPDVIDFDQAMELSRQAGRNAAAGSNAWNDRQYVRFQNIPTIGPNGEPAGFKIVGIRPDGTVDDLAWNQAPVPASMRAKAADIASARDSLALAKKQYKRGLTGPVRGRVALAGSKLGVLTDKDTIRLQSTLQTAKNTLLYARTGKQINLEELHRMEEELPGMHLTDEMNLERFDLTDKNLAFIQKRMLLSGGKPLFDDNDRWVGPQGDTTGSPQSGPSRFQVEQVP